ncbi:MAG: Prolipoprotein diacylglyceryl transferase [Firmicutes bacterium]|nr:Prolipoprotein diacylglyceryl transferase [Bacillota bacterium]
MHPFVFQSVKFSLRWENVAIIVAILTGLWLAQRRAAHKGQAYQDMILDLTIWLVVAGIAGARIWEMIFTWNQYVDHPWERLAFWNGGMSIQGSILGGLLAAVLFAWRRKVRVWELLDILAPPMLLGQAIGRVGCFLSGDAFGQPISTVPWLPSWIGVVYAPNSPAAAVFGRTPLVPAELFEMFLDLVIFAGLLWYKPRREVAGRTVLAYAACYSIARYLLEFLRADSLQFAGLKAAQLLSLAMIAVCAVLLAIRYRSPDINKTKAAG